MGTMHIRLDQTIAATPADVYALLRDGASWPVWSPLGSFELERPGVEEPEGLGAIRVFRTGRIATREEIVQLLPERRFSYVLLSGLAIRNYRADVDLEPTGRGTVIHWHSAFTAKVPGSGWLYRRQLARFIGQLVQGLAAHAEASSRSAHPIGHGASRPAHAA
jgi:Polyketide cyclase / dehydrase and lipid transport